jgi:hypothetical protein
MRPKVVAVVLLIALVPVVGLLYVGNWGNSSEELNLEPEHPVLASRGAAAQPVVARAPEPFSKTESETEPTEAQPAPPAPEIPEQLEEKIAQLEAVAEWADEGALLAVTRDLLHPARTVRLAAARIAMELGDREAIPFLEAAAADTEDSQEKAAYQEAIDFLKLPTLTEWRKRR